MKKLVLSIVIGSLAACASAPDLPVAKYNDYDKNASRALNIWHATGMDGDLRDTELPREQISRFWTSGTGKVVGVGVDVASASFTGLSSSMVGGLSFANAILAPTVDASRNSVFFWTKDTGQSEYEARAEMLNKFDAAATSIIESSGLVKATSTTVRNKAENAVWVSVVSFRGGYGCVEQEGFPDSGTCAAVMRLPKLTLGEAPTWLGLPEGKYWIATASDNVQYGYIKITDAVKKNNLPKFNELDFLTKISEAYGDGFYIYTAPNKVQAADGTAVKMPLILEKGEILPFIIESNS